MKEQNIELKLFSKKIKLFIINKFEGIKAEKYKNSDILKIDKINLLNLDEEPLHSIFIGIMLGDGSIYRSSLTSNSSGVALEISFGEKYKSFAEHICNLFIKYIKTKEVNFIQEGVKTVKIKGINKDYINYRIKTKTLPFFNKFHDLFYLYNPKNKKLKKIIPYNIIETMNPKVLAYLIMTDGNYDKLRKRVRIYTNSYTKEEVELLAKSIYLNLNIYTGVLYDRNNQ